jgi:hypothetical protein
VRNGRRRGGTVSSPVLTEQVAKELVS